MQSMTFEEYWEAKGHFGCNPEEVAKLAWDAAIAACEGREEPECRCYCVGDQADASDCPLHGVAEAEWKEWGL